MTMPLSVKIFLFLIVVVMLWWIALNVWFIAFPPAFFATPAHGRRLLIEAETNHIRTAAVCGVVFALALLAAFARQNWARWTLAVLFVVFVLVPSIAGYGKMGMFYLRPILQNPLSLWPEITLLVAIIFAFTGASSRWFHHEMD